MYVKIHKSNDRNVVAVCDEDLIGKKFETEKLVLDVTERFYKGEKVTEDQAYELMKDAMNLNIVGENSVNLALRRKIITTENILKIDGIPHAQVYQV